MKSEFQVMQTGCRKCGKKAKNYYKGQITDDNGNSTIFTQYCFSCVKKLQDEIVNPKPEKEETPPAEAVETVQK